MLRMTEIYGGRLEISTMDDSGEGGRELDERWFAVGKTKL